MAGLDEREPRDVARHERLAREQGLDVHLEEPQLERGDVLAAHEHALGIGGDLERGLLGGHLGVRLLAAPGVGDDGRGAVDLVEHREHRAEAVAPAVDAGARASGRRARAPPRGRRCGRRRRRRGSRAAARSPIASGRTRAGAAQRRLDAVLREQVHGRPPARSSAVGRGRWRHQLEEALVLRGEAVVQESARSGPSRCARALISGETRGARRRRGPRRRAPISVEHGPGGEQALAERAQPRPDPRRVAVEERVPPQGLGS